MKLLCKACCAVPVPGLTVLKEHFHAWLSVSPVEQLARKSLCSKTDCMNKHKEVLVFNKTYCKDTKNGN